MFWTMAMTFLVINVQCFQHFGRRSLKCQHQVCRRHSNAFKEVLVKLANPKTDKIVVNNSTIVEKSSNDKLEIIDKHRPNSIHRKAKLNRPSRLLKEKLIRHVPSGEPLPYASDYHTPVMVKEVMDVLITDPNGFYIDCTLGGGGHSEAILDRLIDLGGTGRLLSIDRDPEAIDTAVRRYHSNSARAALYNARFTASLCDFKQLPEEVAPGGLLNNQMPPDNLGCHGIFLDLGISSHQVDESSRGFSYMRDGPLDMRMGKDEALTAAVVVNEWGEEEIARVLWQYGDLRRSRKIAAFIVQARPITTTGELASVVRRSLPPGPQKEKYKCLSRVFQALRIVVNDELGALETLLVGASQIVRPGGRIVTLSYHSLEDKRVKCVLRSGLLDGVVRSDLHGNTLSPWKPIPKVPKFPSNDEIATNVRARSAKLRAAVRTDYQATI